MSRGRANGEVTADTEDSLVHLSAAKLDVIPLLGDYRSEQVRSNKRAVATLYSQAQGPLHVLDLSFSNRHHKVISLRDQIARKQCRGASASRDADRQPHSERKGE